MHAQPGMAPQFAQPQANTAQVHKRAMQRCTMQQVAGGKTCAAPPNGRGAAASARGSLEKVGIRHLSRLLSACVAAAVELRPPSKCAPLCQAGKKESKRCQESLASAQRWPREARLTRFGVQAQKLAQNRRATHLSSRCGRRPSQPGRLTRVFFLARVAAAARVFGLAAEEACPWRCDHTWTASRPRCSRPCASRTLPRRLWSATTSQRLRSGESREASHPRVWGALGRGRALCKSLLTLCSAWPLARNARRASKELLLNPIVIHRSEHECVMIETAVNSVRISIKVKQLDEMDAILANNHEIQTAAKFVF